ncbi:MAG: PEP-utilizing enzyme [Patescibacteria group bacterium]|jgi:phosphohistidine swiveling domain-containing protein
MSYTNFKKHTDWVKVWSGRWSFHSDVNFGYHWTVMNKVANKPAYEQIIYIYKKGITDCWVSEADKADLGKRLVEVYKDSKNVKVLANTLKKKAREVFAFIESCDSKNITKKNYQAFWHLAGEYYLPHLSVKYIVDYFSPSQLKKFLPILEDARLFSEPVFRDIENFMEAIAEDIAKKTGYRREQIISTTADEILKYFDKGKLPNKKHLSERYKKSAILVKQGKYWIYAGNQTNKIDNILLTQKTSQSIKGSIAYKGIATGRVRLVIDPRRDSSAFRAGEILVTGMTRPEFLPIMKKAVAFITDAGGILSHAAIVARELKKPCIIGTHVATRLLKNGDLVEVDANKGIIKILD